MAFYLAQLGMRITKNLALVFLLFYIGVGYSNDGIWDKTGHRVVGEVAQHYLKPAAKRAIEKLLNGQTLAEVSTYADEIKSDSIYDRFYNWHFVNFPLDEEYGESPLDPKGDIITAIAHCREVIADEHSSDADKAFYLKLLVHFIGDLHQPLHIGRAEDRGGNDIMVQWFYNDTNLHSVWDSKLINFYGMSYTELSNTLPKIDKKIRKQLQSGTVLDWVKESRELAVDVYNSVESEENLRYRYHYVWWPTVEQQLLKGGLRLARVLNELF